MNLFYSFLLHSLSLNGAREASAMAYVEKDVWVT